MSTASSLEKALGIQLKTYQMAVRALQHESLDFDHAERLLKQAREIDLKAIEKMQENLGERKRSAAETSKQLGDLEMTRFAYTEAAEYYLDAVQLAEQIMEGSDNVLAEYLMLWGTAAHEAARYSTAEGPLSAR